MSQDPSYDEEVTSLLTHNQMVRHGLQPADDGRQSLLGAYVLRSFVKAPTQTEQELKSDLTACGNEILNSLGDVLHSFISKGLLDRSAETLTITTAGEGLLADAAAHESLLSEQFHEQIRQRVRPALTRKGGPDLERLSSIIATYFKDLGRECGLGIAQQLTRVDENVGPESAIALREDLDAIGHPASPTITALVSAIIEGVGSCAPNYRVARALVEAFAEMSADLRRERQLPYALTAILPRAGAKN